MTFPVASCLEEILHLQDLDGAAQFILFLFSLISFFSKGKFFVILAFFKEGGFFTLSYALPALLDVTDRNWHL